MCDDFIGGGDDDCWDGLDAMDWMIIGPLSESIASEQRERERIQREFENDEEDGYWDIINKTW